MQADEAQTALDRATGLSAREWTVVGIGVAVATLPAVMPVMVGALAAQPGIGIAKAGYIVSANMGGIFAGTLSSVWLRRHHSPFVLLLAGLAVMVLGNILTIFSHTAVPIFFFRLLSGAGEGVAAAICYKLMAASHRPARSLAFYLAGQGVVGAIGMALLPSLIEAHGWQFFYIAVSLVALPAMALARFATQAPLEDPGRAADIAGSRVIGKSALIMLGCIFLFFTGIASIWAFMEPIGRQNGLSMSAIASVLSASAIASLAGSLTVGIVGDRLSNLVSTWLGAALIGISVFGLFMVGFAPFMVAVCVLNFAWGFQFPFLFRAMVQVDNGGAAALTPMATGAGLMVGPAIGGFLMQGHGIGAVASVFTIFTIGGLVLAYLTNRRGVRKMQIPIAVAARPEVDHA